VFSEKSKVKIGMGIFQRCISIKFFAYALTILEIDLDYPIACMHDILGFE